MRDMSQKQHQKFPNKKKLSVINRKISHKILMSVFAQIFKTKIKQKNQNTKTELSVYYIMFYPINT